MVKARDFILQSGITVASELVREEVRITPHQLRIHRNEFSKKFFCILTRTTEEERLEYPVAFCLWMETERTPYNPRPEEPLSLIVEDAICIYQSENFTDWRLNFFKNFDPSIYSLFLQGVYGRHLENFHALKRFTGDYWFEELMRGRVKFPLPGGMSAKGARIKSDACCVYSDYPTAIGLRKSKPAGLGRWLNASSSDLFSGELLNPNALPPELVRRRQFYRNHEKVAA